MYERIRDWFWEKVEGLLAITLLPVFDWLDMVTQNWPEWATFIPSLVKAALALGFGYLLLVALVYLLIFIFTVLKSIISLLTHWHTYAFSKEKTYYAFFIRFKKASDFVGKYLSKIASVLVSGIRFLYGLISEQMLEIKESYIERFNIPNRPNKKYQIASEDLWPLTITTYFEVIHSWRRWLISFVITYLLYGLAFWFFNQSAFAGFRWFAQVGYSLIPAWGHVIVTLIVSFAWAFRFLIRGWLINGMFDLIKPFADYVTYQILHSIGAREPSEREKDSYVNALSTISNMKDQDSEIQSHTKMWAVDVPFPRAWTLGEDLIMTRTAFESDDIAAIVAHQQGLLATGWGRTLLALKATTSDYVLRTFSRAETLSLGTAVQIGDAPEIPAGIDDLVKLQGNALAEDMLKKESGIGVYRGAWWLARYARYAEIKADAFVHEVANMEAPLIEYLETWRELDTPDLGFTRWHNYLEKRLDYLKFSVKYSDVRASTFS